MKLLLGVLCSISMVWGADASTAAIRDAATKAVALIQKSQQNWYSKQSCFSCHQQLMPALAFRAAREHGDRHDERGQGGAQDPFASRYRPCQPDRRAAPEGAGRRGQVFEPNQAARLADS